MYPNNTQKKIKKIPKRLRKDEDRGGGGDCGSDDIDNPHHHRTKFIPIRQKYFNNSIKCNDIDKIMLGLCVVVIFLIENCWAGYACLSNPCIFGVCMDDINR